MNDKKPYNAPQLVRVELNHEQAILSTCILSATSAQAGGGTWCRLTTQCKRATNSGTANSAARAS